MADPLQPGETMEAIQPGESFESIGPSRPDFSQNPPSGVTGPAARGSTQGMSILSMGGLGPAIPVSDIEKGRQVASRIFGNRPGIGSYSSDPNNPQAASVPLTPQEQRDAGVTLGATFTAPLTGGLGLIGRMAAVGAGTGAGSAAGQLSGTGTVSPTSTAVDAGIGATTELGFSAARGALGSLVRRFSSMSAPEAAAAIKDAINPAAKDVPRFNDAAESQVARIQDYARRTNQPIDTRADFLKAVEGAKAEQSSMFYDKMLKPIANEPIASPAGFQGQTIGEGTNQTTLGNLDKRLTIINATLEPKYESGAPLNAEQTVALKAEANAIRQQLYKQMGEKLGMDPAQIAQVRGNIGALGELSYQGELSINKAQAATNAQAQKPLTLNPFAGTQSPARFIGDPTVNKIANAMRGNPADNLISRSFRQLKSSAPITPEINPPTSAPPTRTPAWMSNPGTGPRGSHVMEAMRQAGTSVDLDNAAMKQALAENPSLQGLGERAQAIKARMQGGSAAEAQAQREWNAGAATRSDEIPTNRPSTEGLTDQQKWNSQAASRFPLPGGK